MCLLVEPSSSLVVVNFYLNCFFSIRFSLILWAIRGWGSTMLQSKFRIFANCANYVKGANRMQQSYFSREAVVRNTQEYIFKQWTCKKYHVNVPQRNQNFGHSIRPKLASVWPSRPAWIPWWVGKRFSNRYAVNAPLLRCFLSVHFYRASAH